MNLTDFQSKQREEMEAFARKPRVPDTDFFKPKRKSLNKSEIQRVLQEASEYPGRLGLLSELQVAAIANKLNVPFRLVIVEPFSASLTDAEGHTVGKVHLDGDSLSVEIGSQKIDVSSVQEGVLLIKDPSQIDLDF